MAMTTTTILQNTVDKITRWAGLAVGDDQLSGSFNAGFTVANDATLTVAAGGSALATYIDALTGQLDFAADMLPAARDLFNNPPVPADLRLTSIAKLMAVFTALDTHYKRYGYASMDAYLTALNGIKGMTPTLRMHEHCRRYFLRPSPLNTFIAADRDICIYTVDADEPLQSLGNIDKTKNGGAKFVVKNVGDVTDNMTVSVSVTKIDGTTGTLTCTITTETDGHETDLSDTSKINADVTDITVGSATAGDQIKVVAKTDRSIASA